MDTTPDSSVTWRCLVCQKPSNQINVLPCQHKFCRHCLELWSGVYLDMYHGCDGEFPCQVCWKLYSVPSQGIQAFEQDYQVEALQQGFSNMMVDNTAGQACESGPFSYNPSFSMQPEIAITADAAIQQGALAQPSETTQQQACMDDDWAGYNLQCDFDSTRGTLHSPVTTTSGYQSPDGSTSQCHSPGGSTAYPASMVSHVVPQTYYGCNSSVDVDQSCTSSPGYCLRNCHLYSHLC